MKVSTIIAGALLGSASALQFTDQKIIAPGEQQQQSLEDVDASTFFKAAAIIPKVAQALNLDISKVGADVYRLWSDVMAEVPGAIEQLRMPSKKGGRKKSRNVDWMDVKTMPEFPDYALKVNSPKSLKIDTVKQYSGYLDTADDKHFFYWFFESRNDPKNDPVVLWLNGGPGCSSMMALMEFGPSFVGKGGKLTYNPDAWNSNASIIILDQPVNVGFSYSESETVHDTVQAAKDVFAFLTLFFTQFPEYKTNPFSIAGESYAGHYIPVMASEILSHEDAIFNLTSVLIGNGLTDPLHQYDDYEKMACGEGGYPSVLSEEECQGMIDAQPQCNRLIENCYESQSVWYCVPAAVYCNNKMMGPYQQTGLNVYDIREKCGNSDLCYDEIGYLEEYLNQEEVKAALGVEVDQYQACNMQMNQDFLFHGDWMMPYYTAVSDVLNQGLPVLLYEGDKDFICNWVGNEHWARALEWKGTKDFAKAPLKKYYVDGKESGQVANHDIFTFLRVYDAGHMVPFNQHRVANDFFNRWLAGERDLS